MRGVPGGKQPTALNEVGFTGSLESLNERGPKEGLVSLNFSWAQAVMGGSSAMNPQERYLVWGLPRKFQTPERSGVAACCAAKTPENASANNHPIHCFRIFNSSGTNPPLRFSVPAR